MIRKLSNILIVVLVIVSSAHGQKYMDYAPLTIGT